jgi:hypothetical protein
VSKHNITDKKFIELFTNLDYKIVKKEQESLDFSPNSAIIAI